MTTMWHGWETPQGTRLYIGPLPHNKSICLYRQNDANIVVLARFISEELALNAAHLLDILIPKQVNVPDNSPSVYDQRFGRLAP